MHVSMPGSSGEQLLQLPSGKSMGGEWGEGTGHVLGVWGGQKRCGAGRGMCPHIFLHPYQGTGLQLGRTNSRQESSPQPRGQDLAQEGVPLCHGCPGEAPLANW